MTKIMIDPGHAPGNANKGRNGYYEYAGMWKLSNYLKQSLDRCGVQADLTRNEQQDPSLTARGAKAKGYDLFISEHSNAASGTARGCECFYSLKQNNNRAVAADLSRVSAELMGNPDRGAKTNPGTNDPTSDYYTVMASAVAVGCPKVFLIESGFHDNVNDEAFLLNDENLKKLAEAQTEVICRVLNVAYKKENEISNKTCIMGNPVMSAGQLATYLLKNNLSTKINCTPYELAQFFIEEGKAEGVRGDIAFCQSLHETGWFTFGGQVLPEQNNFCGLGAVNNSPVGKGAWFDTPRLGIRAQIQHLKAYASTAEIVNECIDPRFGLVQRGVAPNWEDLNGRWAVPGPTYGQSILKLFDSGKNIAVDFPLIGVTGESQKHWADEAFQYLNNNRIAIREKRFDDGITRAEVFSLLAQIVKMIIS